MPDINCLTVYFNEVKKYPLLTYEEEKELSKEIQEKNSKKAIDKLVNSNLRIVVSMALKYKPKLKGMSLEDIICSGNIGLIKAAEMYRYQTGNRFITYAYNWIKQSILKEFKNSFFVHIPDHKFNQQLDEYFIHVSSLDKVLSDDNLFDEKNSKLEDLIGYEEFDHLEYDEYIKYICQNLSDEEYKIINYYYYLDDEGSQLNLEDIGSMFNISRERVRQKIVKIKEKMEKSFKNHDRINDAPADIH